MEEKPRLRRLHSKVTTGCLTCRKRRIKCDERKPTCLKCEKASRKCEGYRARETWLFETKGTSAPETFEHDNDAPTIPTDVPFPASSSSTLQSDICSNHTVGRVKTHRVLSGTSAPVLIVPTGPYQSFDEQRAFKFYSEIVAAIPARYSDPHVWSVVVPQSAWQHQAPRNALLGLSLAAERMRSADRIPGIANQRQILRHINFAMRGLVTDKSPIHIVLLTGILLQFLENLNQNTKTALLHTHSSWKIFLEYKAKVERGEPHDQSETDLILDYLGPTIDIALQFAALTDGGKHDHNSLESVERRKALTRPGVVDSFRDQMDVRNNLGYLALKVVGVRREMQALVYTNSSLPEAILAKIDEASRLLQHFVRLFKPIRQIHDLVDQFLLLHAKTIAMMLQDVVPFTFDLSLPDLLIPGSDYGEVLSEALFLTTDSFIQSDVEFKVELGLIPPLFYIATAASRVPRAVRQQATSALARILPTRREGAWTGYQASKIAGLRLELEDNSILKPESAIKDIKLEVIEALSPTKSPTETDREVCASFVTSEESTRVRLHTSTNCSHKCHGWTTSEVESLPTNIDELFVSSGYQGYFKEAEALRANSEEED